MEKKIIFTPVEPNRNLLWLHYREDHLVLERFGSNGWESIGDTDHVTEEEFIEALKNKADLVGGKVPAEQLPSYVDDVVEFDRTQLPDTQILVIVGNNSYKNKTVFVNGSTNSSDRIGSQDKYPNMFVNFGENTSESDWVASLPEEGKIYINTDNNHSYRWSGSYLIDLDQSWSQGIKDLQENTIRTDISQDFSTEEENQALSNIGSGLLVVDLVNGQATLTEDQEAKLLSSSGVILRGTVNAGKEVLTKIYYADYQGGTRVSFYAVRNNGYILRCDYDKQTKIFSFVSSVDYIDPSAVSIKSQTLTNAQQDVALSNIGLDFVHVDYSILGTTLTDAQVESISNSRGIILTNGTNYDGPTVFIKGHTSSTGQLFFAQDASSVVRQITLNINNKTLSIISSIVLHFDSVRYSVTQTLTDTQKQQARTNIGVQSADELLGDADFIAQLKTKLETV